MIRSEPLTWQTSLPPAAASAIATLAGRTLLVDGVAPLSGHVLDALGSGGDAYLLVGAHSAPIGVAVAHEDDPVELFVDPVRRRHGVGQRLLAAALARSGAVWAHGNLPAARALAAANGLARARELLQLRRPLDPGWAADQLLAAPLPAGVRLRTFVPGQDEQQFLAVNARAFSWHPEQGRLDRGGLEREMAQPWFDPLGFFLAVDDTGSVLGFHWTKVHDETPEPLGEVYVLGVDPAGRLAGVPVRGLGAPLTAAGLAHLAGRGLRTVALYVEGDNDKALRLYRRLGFQTFSTDVVYRLDSTAL